MFSGFYRIILFVLTSFQTYYEHFGHFLECFHSDLGRELSVKFIFCSMQPLYSVSTLKKKKSLNFLFYFLPHILPIQFHIYNETR